KKTFALWLFVFCLLLARAGDTDSVTITGQLLGSCTINNFQLKSFDLNQVQSFGAEIGNYGSFQFKVPAGVPRQYTLYGQNLRHEFIITPGQNTYRFSVTCQSENNISVKLEDSPENDAFEVLNNLENRFTKACLNYEENITNKDSCYKALISLFSAHNENLALIAKNYPGTFTATTLVPLCHLPNGLSAKGFCNNYISATLKNPEWANPVVYNTGIPVSFITLIRTLSLNESKEQRAAIIKLLLDKAPAEPEVAKALQQLLYDFLLYEKDDLLLRSMCDWAVANPEKILNPVLKVKLLAMQHILPGGRVIDIALPDTSGAVQKLSQVVAANRYTMLLFWSPSCDHCKKEMPDISALFQKYHKQGLQIFAVAISATPEEWKDFINTHEMDWVNVMEPQNSGNRSLADYIVAFIPTMVLFDAKGEILSRYAGLHEIEEIIKGNSAK
ncbi:MAG TPA: TlpA disulfide reductase family protein, partial [Chitinophagales bacterium]|nr:TlpA disulfide reductase family protein [Chitinophagales bacterium]